MTISDYQPILLHMELPKITVAEESLTPVTLAKKLKENPDILLKELKEEKGIFEDSMQADTILAWDTVQRACEKRGFVVVDNYTSPTAEALNSREKEALKHCISFHKMYADVITESLPKGASLGSSSSKLAEYHKNISQAISSVLEKVEKKEKNQRDVNSPIQTL